MKIFKYITIMALGIFSLASCEKEEPQGLTEERGTAKIIFVNAAPNAATVPAKARREIAIYPYYNQVQYNNFPIKYPYSNGYKHFAPGTLSMRLDTARSQNNDPPGPGAKVVDLEIPMQADTYYSLYAVGTIQNLETVLLTDNLALPTPGKAKIRVMNFSRDAGPVDVVLSGGPLAAPVTIASNLAFKGVRDFFEIDPGVYSMEIREAGTTTRIGAVRNANVYIDANSCYSVWAAGFKTMPSPGNTLGAYALELRYHANRWSNPLVP